MTLDREFQLLGEYMNIYVQLLPYCSCCGGSRINKLQLPTFEYFKFTYHSEEYSLSIPHYKEARTRDDDGKIGPVHTHGLGTIDGIGYRYYNFWMGCKFYTGGNSEGRFTEPKIKYNEN